MKLPRPLSYNVFKHSLVLLGWLLAFAPLAWSQEEHRSPFHRPGAVRAPEVRHTAVARNPIDAFIFERLNQAGLQPAPEASRRTLIRRLYFDLIGLPPTPEEIDGFLSDDAPDAYERLVDRLLTDTRYGERWARFWLDLARYADTAGYEGDPDLPHAWRYRDYVIDAFNHDKPYDVFIKEQIAGDEFEEIMGAGDLPETPPERVVAMTFLRLAPFTEPRGDETRHEMLSEMTSTVGSVFLGLTVGCAKCHDHRYDEIPTRDFYRMQAFFATVSIPRPEPGDVYQIGGSIPAGFYRAGEAEWAAREQKRFEKEIVASKQELKELTKRLEQRLQAESDGNDTGESASAPELKDVIDDESDERISAEERRRFRFLSSRERLLRQQILRLRPVAMSLRHSYGPPYEPGVPTSRVMIRGEYDNPGEAVQPGFLTCITGKEEPAQIRLDPFKRWPTRSRRMALADWIASSANPLTARVMINRLWQRHFGHGLVATPSDFGMLGGDPSHPELLDWLAEQFVQAQWSMKAMQRLMVTSHTYRQRSVWRHERAEEVDFENRLLWRFRRRRLEAEALRDSVLAVSGRLNSQQFGLPIFPPLPDSIGERVKYTDSKWDTQDGPAGRRRSIYIYQQRTLTMPLMQSFDGLVCDESRPLRRTSVTAIQALELYNGRFVSEETRHFARRVLADVEGSRQQQVERAFLYALGRSPSADETAKLLTFLAEFEADPAALEALCRILYNSNEFIYVD